MLIYAYSQDLVRPSNTMAYEGLKSSHMSPTSFTAWKMSFEHCQSIHSE